MERSSIDSDFIALNRTFGLRHRNSFHESSNACDEVSQAHTQSPSICLIVRNKISLDLELLYSADSGRYKTSLDKTARSQTHSLLFPPEKIFLLAVSRTTNAASVYRFTVVNFSSKLASMALAAHAHPATKAFESSRARSYRLFTRFVACERPSPLQLHYESPNLNFSSALWGDPPHGLPSYRESVLSCAHRFVYKH